MYLAILPHVVGAYFTFIVASAVGQYYETTTPKVETWTGRWLPERLPVGINPSPPDLHDERHGVKMGESTPTCDDARTNLTMDWDFSPVNYTCYDKYKIVPDLNLRPLLEKENIPLFYIAQHRCMDQAITYNRTLPTFGTHRPLWPRYGEYKFVPRQRWLHSLESIFGSVTLQHGGIVALYHPCTSPLEVRRLRQLVTRCLWRHIISPSNLVEADRPIALLAWGWRLSLPAVRSDLVQAFIRQHALRGPEAISRDGQYTLGLLQPAQVVSGPEDDILCP